MSVSLHYINDNYLYGGCTLCAEGMSYPVICINKMCWNVVITVF